MSLSPGLRERKKQKTRWSIQEHALRLFAEQGYDATTVDQIAAAAEISPSTFFRYFPTKEDVVIQDEYDAVMEEFIAAAPAGEPPLALIRRAVQESFGTLGADEMERMRTRMVLVMSVPALRARSLENLLTTTKMLSNALCRRLGRDPDDFEVRVLAGAVVGALLAALEDYLGSGPTGDLAQVIDRALGQLEAGLPVH